MLGIRPSRYEGPTGIVGVLNTLCREEGVPTASLWANVPHYVSGVENPKAALALVRRVLTLLGAEADLSELVEATRQFEGNLDEVVGQNAKIAEYVKTLERKQPEDEEAAGPVPGRATSCRRRRISWRRSSSSFASSGLSLLSALRFSGVRVTGREGAGGARHPPLALAVARLIPPAPRPLAECPRVSPAGIPASRLAHSPAWFLRR